MKVLIVDDVRTIDEAIKIGMERNSWFSKQDPSKFDIKLCRTFESGRRTLNGSEQFDVLLLDHDLGSTYVYNDGSALMRDLERKAYQEHVFPAKLIIPISSNPIGVQNIKVIAGRILDQMKKVEKM